MTKDDDVNELMYAVKTVHRVNILANYKNDAIANKSLKNINTLRNLIIENETIAKVNKNVADTNDLLHKEIASLKHDLDRYIKRDAEYLSEIEDLKDKLLRIKVLISDGLDNCDEMGCFDFCIAMDAYKISDIELDKVKDNE